ALLVDDLAAGAAGAEFLEGLVEDLLGLLLGAALLHIGQVGLVGLDLRRRRRVVHIGAGRQTAPWTVPLLRDGRLDREPGRGLVPIRTEEHDALPGRGVAALRLAHRPGTDPAATNRTATTSHANLLPSAELVEQAERDDGSEPDQTDTDGDPVQVPLGDRGTAQAGRHTATEEVRQTATAAFVQQDE